MIEREGLQEGLRRESGPAAEQVVQFGRRDAGRFRDRVDLGLRRASCSRDVRDGAAHDVVIGGCGG